MRAVFIHILLAMCASCDVARLVDIEVAAIPECVTVSGTRNLEHVPLVCTIAWHRPSQPTPSPHAVTQLFEVTCVVGPDLWVTCRGLGDFEVLMSEVRLVWPIIAPILSFSIARVALTTSTLT